MAKPTIESGTDGTLIAARMAKPQAADQVVANVTAPMRSTMNEDTSRPSARDAQNSESASVATSSGASSR
jgi:hypothetical protein